jgi:hypothetical protein
LQQKPTDSHPDPQATEAAVIAAGIFAVMGQAAAGLGERPPLDGGIQSSASSNWRASARRDALR